MSQQSPGGASPDQSADADIAGEASSMSGHGRLLVVYGVGALLLVGAGVLASRSMDRAGAYADAADEVRDIGTTNFDGFFACALPGSDTTQLGSQQVRVALQRLGNNLGKGYAKALGPCEPKMRALGTRLEALQVPEEVQPQRAELVAAGAALAAANTRYLEYLSSEGEEYDHAKAKPMVQAFGDAASEYLRAHRLLLRALEG